MEMRRQRQTLVTAAQNLIEFRNFATCPLADNGLGLPVREAEAKSEEFESLFTVVRNTPDIYPAWKSLASASAATGKKVQEERFLALYPRRRLSESSQSAKSMRVRAISSGPAVLPSTTTSAQLSSSGS